VSLTWHQPIAAFRSLAGLYHSVNNKPVKRLSLLARLPPGHRPFILYRMPVGIMG